MPEIPDCLKFKNDRLREQWLSGKLYPRLTQIVLDAAKRHKDLTDLPATVTSIYREKSKGVHHYWRGCDLRTRDMAEIKHEHWEWWINDRYAYKGKVGCQTALIHNVGRGKHLHLQVGPKEPKEA